MDREAATEPAAQCRRRSEKHEGAEECRGGGNAVAVAPPRPRRRGRCFDDDECSPTTTTQRCRSCAAVAIADCVALGCCPCALVSLLGLALVKAPLVVGRRCVGRLRRRLLLLPHKKRVRDVAAASGAAGSTTCDHHEEKVAGAPVTTMAAASVNAASAPATGPGVEAEPPAWLEEMYRVGHWGFGRVSSSSGEIP